MTKLFGKRVGGGDAVAANGEVPPAPAAAATVGATGPPTAAAAPPPLAAQAGTASDPDLASQRDRLTERFAILQSELGGLFYEMAIRDHVRMEVLVAKAAELQRVDSELGQIERLLETGDSGIGGHCPACGAVYARGAAFCAQCAHPLTAPAQ